MLFSHSCYAFGPYVVDLKRRLLWREQRLVQLNTKTFEVLAALIENRTHTLEKDEFLKLVWPDTIVQESNLVRQISMLRRALGQRPDQHDYVLTIPGRGYQFVGEARVLSSVPDGLATGFPAGSAADDLTSGVLAESFAIPAESDLRTAHDSWPAAPQRAAAPSPELAAKDSTTSRRRFSPLAAILAFAIIGVLLTMAFVYGRSGRVVANARQLRQFTFDSGLSREPAWSPDGRAVAYTSDKAGSPNIWIQSLGQPEPVRLTRSPDRDWQPDWSPDGKWIAFRSERDGGGLDVVPSAGGEPSRVSDFGYRPHWSPDGQVILFSNSTTRTGSRSLYIVAPRGGPPRQILSELLQEFTGSGAFSSFTAAWMPDSQSVSIWGHDTKTGWTFVTAPIDGSRPTRSVIAPALLQQIGPSKLALDNFVWAKSRRSLYFEGHSGEARNIWRIAVDPKSLAWIGEFERLTTGAEAYTDLAISADGSRLAFTARNSETRIWSLPFDGAKGTVTNVGEPVTKGGTDELDADLPSTGTALAYRAVRAGRQEVHTISFSSGQDRVLVASADLNRTSPRWSRDGTFLTYAVRPPFGQAARSDSAIGLLSIESGTERIIILAGEPGVVPMDWSRDSHTILATCRSKASGRLGTCLISLATGSAGAPEVRLTASDPSFNLYCQRFSPDDQWVSFLALGARDLALSRIFVAPYDGGKWTAITEGESYVDKPRWAADGRTIYYLSDRGGYLNVWGRRFDPTSGQPIGKPFQLTRFNTEDRVIPKKLGEMEMAVLSDHLFLPITLTSGAIWVLDQIDR